MMAPGFAGRPGVFVWLGWEWFHREEREGKPYWVQDDLQVSSSAVTACPKGRNLEGGGRERVHFFFYRKDAKNAKNFCWVLAEYVYSERSDIVPAG